MSSFAVLPAPWLHQGVLLGRRRALHSLATPPRLQACNQGRRLQAATTASAKREQASTAPSRAYRVRRGSSRQQRREPFDAELLILFGIPCLVLLIAFAFNDPSSLAVAVPLALLIPGPRDVLLAVASDMLRAVRRAARFVSRDDGELPEAAQALGQQAGARQAQQRARQPSWGRTAPPPPPPPPPVVDVEYTVYPPPPTEPPDKATAAHPASAPSKHETPGQPPAPPYLHPGRRSAPPQQQRDSHQPLYWQHQQPAGRSPSAAGAAGVPFSAGRRSPQQHQPPQHPGRQPQQTRDDAWEAPAVSRRRMPRGGIRAAAAAAPSNVSSAAMAPRHRQRQARAARAFGAAEQRAGDAPPLLLRPLFALVPFLRYWGGFL